MHGRCNPAHAFHSRTSLVTCRPMRKALRLLLFPLFAALVSTQAPAGAARSVDLDQATIADLHAAFNGVTLTSEQLVQRCLARIEAYDRKGPSIHAILTLNPKALETA